MNTFTFDGKTFEFPIGVYVYFGRIGLIFAVFFLLISLFFAITGFIGKNMFGMIFWYDIWHCHIYPVWCHGIFISKTKTDIIS